MFGNIIENVSEAVDNTVEAASNLNAGDLLEDFNDVVKLATDTPTPTDNNTLDFGDIWNTTSDMAEMAADAAQIAGERAEPFVKAGTEYPGKLAQAYMDIGANMGESLEELFITDGPRIFARDAADTVEGLTVLSQPTAEAQRRREILGDFMLNAPSDPRLKDAIRDYPHHLIGTLYERFGIMNYEAAPFGTTEVERQEEMPEEENDSTTQVVEVADDDSAGRIG